MLDNAEIDKLIIYALAGIVLVLTIAVILLAIKKNTYYVPDENERPVRYQERPASHPASRPVERKQTPVSYEELKKDANEDRLTSTLQVPLKVKSAAVRKCLITIAINGRTAEREITSFPCLLGREHDCDIVVAEPAVSRRHARFLLDEGHLYIEDVSGHNGTYLNGQKIPSLGRAEVHEGDRISLGRAAIVIQSVGY